MLQPRHMIAVATALLALAQPSAVRADSFSTMSGERALSISSLCTQYFGRAERKYGIPKHLLLAIATNESGRYHQQAQRTMPWPWTLNIEGAGSYYDTLHDAATAVRRAKQRGQKSIDTGCMQVNLHHHPKAFVSVTDALDPQQNVDYAASFLRSNYDELGSWPKAVAAYHSRTASKGRNYFASVRKRWSEIIRATGGKPLEESGFLTIAATDEVPRHPNARYPNSSFSLALRDENGRRSYEGGEGRSGEELRQRPTMKVISVSTRRANDDAVIVVAQASQRTDNEAFISKPQSAVRLERGGYATALQSRPQEASTPDAQTQQDASATASPRGRSQPNFIFGRQ